MRIVEVLPIVTFIGLVSCASDDSGGFGGNGSGGSTATGGGGSGTGATGTGATGTGATGTGAGGTGATGTGGSTTGGGGSGGTGGFGGFGGNPTGGSGGMGGTGGSGLNCQTCSEFINDPTPLQANLCTMNGSMGGAGGGGGMGGGGGTPASLDIWLALRACICANPCMTECATSLCDDGVLTPNAACQTCLANKAAIEAACDPEVTACEND